MVREFSAGDLAKVIPDYDGTVARGDLLPSGRIASAPTLGHSPC
jgi:hypothetical protein